MEADKFRIVTKQSNIENKSIYSIERFLPKSKAWAAVGDLEKGLIDIKANVIGNMIYENQRHIYDTLSDAKRALFNYIENSSRDSWNVVARDSWNVVEEYMHGL